MRGRSEGGAGGATCVRMAVACAHTRPMVARLWTLEEVRGATQGESTVSGILQRSEIKKLKKNFLKTSKAFLNP